MWNDLLRVAAPVKGGHATAALVVGKLCSSRRQLNSLAAAIKEYGALRRTVYAARYLADEAYRRRIGPAPAAPARQVAAALAAAARHGLAGAAADPVTGQHAGARSLLSRLLDHVYPALGDHGDTEMITRLLHRLDQRGTGADRQRALFTSAASTPAFITALARATMSGHEPGPLAPARCPDPPSTWTRPRTRS